MNRRYRRHVPVFADVVSRRLRELDGGARDDSLLAGLAGALSRNGRREDRAVLDEAVTLLVTGHETVNEALAWTWHLLAAHPDADERVRDELAPSSADGSSARETSRRSGPRKRRSGFRASRGGQPPRVSILDGTWRVERVSGALPPLYGVRKRIAGAEGETLVGRVPLRFDVDGLQLRYRFPLAGLVDELEPENGGYSGRAVMGGRELGRFRMYPAPVTAGTTGEAGSAGETTAGDLVRRHLDEAIAMEANVLRMLDSMIASTDDAEITAELRRHREETASQAERLKDRLRSLGGEPSVVREAGGMLAALMKGVLDAARGEKPGRNARDAYATEHMEIAAYQLLERVAERAGDAETAAVARLNRAEEEAMARTIEARWDRFAELSLREAGVDV